MVDFLDFRNLANNERSRAPLQLTDLATGAAKMSSSNSALLQLWTGIVFVRKDLSLMARIAASTLNRIEILVERF